MISEQLQIIKRFALSEESNVTIHLSSCLLFHLGKNLYQSKPDGIFTGSFAVSEHEIEKSIKAASHKSGQLFGSGRTES